MGGAATVTFIFVMCLHSFQCTVTVDIKLRAALSITLSVTQRLCSSGKVSGAARFVTVGVAYIARRQYIINTSLPGLVDNMARHCTRVQHFPSPTAREILVHTRAIYRYIAHYTR